MKSATTWFVILATCCIVGPYLFGVQPRTQREWRYIAITLAFLAWLLLAMVSLLAAAGATGQRDRVCVFPISPAGTTPCVARNARIRV